MDKEQFERKRQWAGELKPSMKRRRVGHDYQRRCVYMITLAVEGRRPLLGSVTGDGETVPAVFTPSPLGEEVVKTLHSIPEYYPQVAIWQVQLMPDHLHVILFVKERLPVHLGIVINGFKVGCNRIYRSMMGEADGMMLWEDGYNDRILEHEGQLQSMKRYLSDNPRRLAIKRHHPDLFTVQRGVQAGGINFAALGNLFLLDVPLRVAVKCSRKLTEQEIADRCRYFLSLARDGAVLVSPAISPGEKKVMRTAYNNGYPTIILLENGFAPLAKPGGQRFDACAAGKLLLLAPWPHHNDDRTITQVQCHALNDMAAAIASMPQ